jgi:hydrogenase nickel incorporation protein HypA/HybF
MHELGITQEILKLVLNAAEEKHAQKIVCVDLKIGEFTAIEPECVRFYFELTAKGTLAEAANLRIQSLPLRLKCQECQRVLVPEAPYSFKCPDCKVNNLKIIQGKELYIESIEIN